MLGDYSEFENICKVLVCNELVKCLFGICLMMFQRVSHSLRARHLQKVALTHVRATLHIKMFLKF